MRTLSKSTENEGSCKPPYLKKIPWYPGTTFPCYQAGKCARILHIFHQGNLSGLTRGWPWGRGCGKTRVLSHVLHPWVPCGGKCAGHEDRWLSGKEPNRLATVYGKYTRRVFLCYVFSPLLFAFIRTLIHPSNLDTNRTTHPYSPSTVSRPYTTAQTFNHPSVRPHPAVCPCFYPSVHIKQHRRSY